MMERVVGKFCFIRELPAAEKAVNGFLMKNTPELAEERT